MNEDPKRYTEERVKLRQEVFFNPQKIQYIEKCPSPLRILRDWVSTGEQSTVGCEQTFSNIENKLELKTVIIVRVPNGPDRYITDRVLVDMTVLPVCINERTLTALCVFREDWSSRIIT